MLKVKPVLAVLPVAFLFWVMAAAVLAQEEVPAPYAGQENPFAWEEETAISAGQELYNKSCLGCHGIGGDNLADADFSEPDYARQIKDRPDFFFWVISEGALERGMPPFKSSFSEEERWQVITFLPNLAAAEPPPEEKENGEKETPETPSPAPEEEQETEPNTLAMVVPERVASGEPLMVTAYLRDGEENPVSGTEVTFFIEVDFFTRGRVEIGRAETDENGMAVLRYTPRPTGNLQVVASSGDAEASAPLRVTKDDGPHHEAELGVPLPTPGEEVFIGPESSRSLDESSSAPTSALRLPGGIVSWLLLVIFTVALIWFTYFRVVYQMYRIPVLRDIRDTDTRLLPRIGMVIVIVVGVTLVLMILTGPYSHFHTLP